MLYKTPIQAVRSEKNKLMLGQIYLLLMKCLKYD